MKKFVTTLALLALPAVTQAQNLGGTRGLIEQAGQLVERLTIIVAGIALLVFFWGLVKFIWSTSSTGKTEGKSFMLWGVIALFVMVSIWGLVRFIQRDVLGLSTYNSPIIPVFNQP